jgi:hypothetical protein
MTHAIAGACRGILGSAVRIMSATAPVGFTVVILVAIASCACMAQEVLTPAALVKGTVVRLQWSPERSSRTSQQIPAATLTCDRSLQ